MAWRKGCVTDALERAGVGKTGGDEEEGAGEQGSGCHSHDSGNAAGDKPDGRQERTKEEGRARKADQL
jgi:hypothetical protein